ncbi:cytidylate kinase region [Beutenbergia cavernae DSM 12333]|uniref:Cytidylate kinase n=1 Tax=Beutenbergia cavernae (strain ATCC BAA-8 / DSM 12333 / CCUG 43141 / JCM 11478 / NBRC 16432 / NCIMB 13614 / HKI 0122) TaxID=471853 RepID=C5C6J6_BEUC1|nr:(d)CMP kinase [Beutenbergia cavernae]ACQ80402.1 cytidylate kinase region [Beutenbergia cavernae DSM 12333]
MSAASQEHGRRGVVVAIDGPSGSGKSTIGRHLAATRGLAYLDTGAMYRAATWWCREEGVDLDDEDAVRRAVAVMPLEMRTDPAQARVVVGDADVTDAIRTTQITTIVSKVATNLGVRAWMRVRQRSEIADALRVEGSFEGRGIVAEGRDITTVVAPDADVRILLLAREDARLARRAREVHGSDDDDAIAATRDQVLRRDADDSTVSTFTVAADGVVTVDTSDLDLQQAIAAVEQVVAERLAARTPS